MTISRVTTKRTFIQVKDESEMNAAKKEARENDCLHVAAIDKNYVLFNNEWVETTSGIFQLGYNDYIPVQFRSVGGLPPITVFKVTIDCTNGVMSEHYMATEWERTFFLEPLQGYLPPLSFGIAPPTGTEAKEYDRYTGAITLHNTTADSLITGLCRPIPHKYNEITNFPMTYDDLTSYGLTYNDIKGVSV